MAVLALAQTSSFGLLAADLAGPVAMTNVTLSNFRFATDARLRFYFLGRHVGREGAVLNPLAVPAGRRDGQ